MATLTSILDWCIPWTEGSLGGLQSVGSQRAGHDRIDLAYSSTHKPGFPILHHLSEFAQTHVHCVSDAIQPYHPLQSPFIALLYPLISSRNFCQFFQIVYKNDYIICDKRQFYVFLLPSVYLCCCCLIVLARTSSTVLKRSVK